MEGQLLINKREQYKLWDVITEAYGRFSPETRFAHDLIQEARTTAGVPTRDALLQMAALAIDPDGVTGPAHDIAMALVARDVVESLANEKVRSVIAAYQAVRFTRSLYSVYR